MNVYEKLKEAQDIVKECEAEIAYRKLPLEPEKLRSWMDIHEHDIRGLNARLQALERFAHLIAHDPAVKCQVDEEPPY